MAITIKGLRLARMSLERDPATGIPRVTGSYEVITSADTVLAKQGFNGYGDVTVSSSPRTTQLINELFASLTADLETTTGLA